MSQSHLARQRSSVMKHIYFSHLINNPHHFAHLQILHGRAEVSDRPEPEAAVTLRTRNHKHYQRIRAAPACA